MSAPILNSVWPSLGQVTTSGPINYGQRDRGYIAFIRLLPPSPPAAASLGEKGLRPKLRALNKTKIRGQELTFSKLDVLSASETVHIFLNRCQFSQLCEMSVNNLILQMREVKALAQDMGFSKGAAG